MNRYLALSRFWKTSRLQAIRVSSLIFLAIALAIAEVINQSQATVDPAHYGLTLVLGTAMCVGVALLGPRPLLGGMVCILFSGLDIILDTNVTFPSLGIYIVVTDWVAHRWFARAAAILLLNSVLVLIHNHFSLVTLTSSVMSVGISVAFGLTLLWAQDRVRAARVEARAEITRDLSAELHDTVARDLTRIIVTAEQIAFESGPSPETQQIQACAREALASTRSIIDGRPERARNESFHSVITKCSRMLEMRLIQLNTDVPENILDNLPRMVKETIILAVKEGAANILKYAAADSDADLIIANEYSSGRILLTLSNTYEEDSRPHSLLAGQFGLKNLEARAEVLGGQVMYGALNGKWILTLDLPATEPAGNELDLETEPATHNNIG